MLFLDRQRAIYFQFFNILHFSGYLNFLIYLFHYLSRNPYFCSDELRLVNIGKSNVLALNLDKSNTMQFITHSFPQYALGTCYYDNCTK